MNEERLRRFLTLSLALFMGASLFYVCFRYVLPWCLPFLARAARRGAAGTGRFVSAAEISLSTWLFRADPDADAAVSARRAAVAPVVYAAFSDERAARRRARVFRRDPRRSGRSALPIGAVQRVESRMAQRLSARAAFQGRHGRGQPAALAVFARDGVGSALPPRRCRAACSPSRRACLRSSSPPRRTPSSARHSNTPCRKKRWQSCGSFAAA